jgi:hypothetical protein
MSQYHYGGQSISLIAAGNFKWAYAVTFLESFVICFARFGLTVIDFSQDLRGGNMTTSSIKANIRRDIQKVWETILAVENYHTWRSDVDRIEVIDEKRFITYTGDGYSTTFTVTVAEPFERWELDVENSDIKGHWAVVLASRGGETEINFTASAAAKKLLTRPIGKSVFEKVYLDKEQTRFIVDLKKVLG